MIFVPMLHPNALIWLQFRFEHPGTKGKQFRRTRSP